MNQAPDIPSIENTISQLEGALKSFEEAGFDRENDPQAKEVYMGLYKELVRMKKNLETLKGHMKKA
jgi:hypothetical protein